MTDDELDTLWKNRFGHEGKFANDTNKLDLTSLSEDEKIKVGRVVAYYHPSDNNVYKFYMGVLCVPNRVIMESILCEGESNV